MIIVLVRFPLFTFQLLAAALYSHWLAVPKLLKRTQFHLIRSLVVVTPGSGLSSEINLSQIQKKMTVYSIYRENAACPLLHTHPYLLIYDDGNGPDGMTTEVLVQFYAATSD